jgi:hypothetical protein
MTPTRYLFLSLLTISLSAPVHAQDEEPLRPEDAYRYVLTDTGTAIEVDWAIEDGYYLYALRATQPLLSWASPSCPKACRTKMNSSASNRSIVNIFM